MTALIPQEGLDCLRSAKRVVIKIGSHLIASSQQNVRHQWLESVASDIVAMMKEGKEVLLVSSGAVALGSGVLHDEQSGKQEKAGNILSQQQGLSAIGQVKLMALWKASFEKERTHVAQCLLTKEDTENRHRYINVRDTFNFLFHKKIVPIINENDTVSTEEIRYGDNDRLAARIAVMVEAEALVILSDVDGLYDRGKGQEDRQTLVSKVSSITQDVRKMAYPSTGKSSLSKGGMQSKIDAADMATTCCCHTWIASGIERHPLERLLKNRVGTWFVAQEMPLRARKKWLFSTLEQKGVVTIDPGACVALSKGGSLLALGILSYEGDFKRGDVVLIVDETKNKIALGLMLYSREELEKIGHVKSRDIVNRLGYSRGDAIIHRDNIAFLSTKETETS